VAPLPRGPIPASVIVAVAATSVTVLLGLVMDLINLGKGGSSIEHLGTSTVIGGLILFGMVKGHRLAWQWGRIVGVLYVIFLGIGMMGIVASLPKMGDAGLVALALTGVLGLCMLTTVIALSLPSAFAHFRLVCPQCAQRTTKAADFLFQKAKCSRCNLTF
jgi:hypothetical protein